MTGIVSSASWPGLFRPSAHQRQGADGRDKPVHDGETRAHVSSYRENALIMDTLPPRAAADGPDCRRAMTEMESRDQLRLTYSACSGNPHWTKRPSPVQAPSS